MCRSIVGLRNILESDDFSRNMGKHDRLNDEQAAKLTDWVLSLVC